MNRLFVSLVMGIMGGILGVLIIMPMLEKRMIEDSNLQSISNNMPSDQNLLPVHREIIVDSTVLNTDFVSASSASTNSVVFIQTVTEYEFYGGSVFDWFFEPRSSQRAGSGSGVIFSKDGYIVTNNHVIEDADIIKVTIGKEKFDAELVGADPSSDIAVIKIEENDLLPLKLGNSKDVNVGEWVLAVGNPFNLTSTVTAGIVSAKGRNINILKDKFPIESFIQTDAAINPGNSGGALVNKYGELIGINTAILSRTGSYAGYGFAVPVDIVKKVFSDIVQYGQVQKAIIGAMLLEVDSEIADRLELQDLNGVIITSITPEGSAEKAGLKKGDVIYVMNGKKIETKAQIEEQIAQSYPGDELFLLINRNNKQIEKKITLMNKEGGMEILTRNTFYSEELGATFEVISKAERNKLRIKGGIRVVDYESRGFFAQLELPKDFIITSINGSVMESPDELVDLLSNIRGRVVIIGVDNKGNQVYYPYRF